MKKQNYAIKLLCCALLFSSTVQVSGTNSEVSKKHVLAAVGFFKQQMSREEPTLHWDDLVKIMHHLLEKTEYGDGARSLKRLDGVPQAKVVGPMLLNMAPKMPAEICAAIRTMKNDTQKLAMRFESSLKRKRLTEKEREQLINELLK